MKPKYEKILSRQNSSIHVHRAINKYLVVPWHYHPEIELTYIHKGNGTKYIGSSIESFVEGEIVLLGPNIPHLWKNDPEYYNDENDLKHEDWVIQFDENFWGSDFFNLPEMSGVRKLLKNSRKGIIFHFNQKEKSDFVKTFDRIFKVEPLQRLQLLLKLLGLLAKCRDTDILSSTEIDTFTTSDQNKMLAVQKYVTDNYTGDISLETVSAIANLSVSGFCRYFKKKTNKTFVEYVNEVRIGYACKLLIKDDASVTAICYECGFNNFSNFSRQFKKVTGHSPLSYRKAFSFS